MTTPFSVDVDVPDTELDQLVVSTQEGYWGWRNETSCTTHIILPLGAYATFLHTSLGMGSTNHQACLPRTSQLVHPLSYACSRMARARTAIASPSKQGNYGACGLVGQVINVLDRGLIFVLDASRAVSAAKIDTLCIHPHSIIPRPEISFLRSLHHPHMVSLIDCHATTALI